MNKITSFTRVPFTWKSETEAAERSETSLTISRLATLLANGVRVQVGEAFPDGWDDSAEGRRRRYSQALPRQIRAARRLLVSDSSGESVASFR